MAGFGRFDKLTAGRFDRFDELTAGKLTAGRFDELTAGDPALQNRQSSAVARLWRDK
jgi:hypothetical protein